MLQSFVPIAASRESLRELQAKPWSLQLSPGASDQGAEALEGLAGLGHKERLGPMLSPIQSSLQNDMVAIICLSFHRVQNKTHLILEVLNHLITDQNMDTSGALFKNLADLSG